MDKIKISAVSYTNTLPFLNGISHSPVSDQIDLRVDHPSACAQRVIDNEVDMGIIPTAALLSLPQYYINTDFCIGTEGAVDSVFIFSQKPADQISSILLDQQSRTSNGLARILLKYHWNREVEIKSEGEADAYVLIGDRTFGKKDTVPYVYDLGLEWKKFTGLPFAFALWVSNKELPKEFLEKFNEALRYGVEHADDVIAGLPTYAGLDYHRYLTQNLDFHLTAEKRKAVEKYLTLYKTL